MEEEHMPLSDSTVNNDIDDSCTEEEDQETHNDSATSSSTMSILERLKSPTPSDLARKSAASERVFSILNNSFNTKQQQSLQDLIEASVMLQYNR